MDEILYFNPQTLREHAQRVKRAAGRQLFGRTILGLLIGAVVGSAFANPFENPLFLIILTALIGGGAGFLVGDAHAEEMELAVRTALAQAAADEARTSAAR
jgi:hypothetical protein